ncbi:MAG: sarcosine oxidase subunit alpha family protein [Gammaproteobacteria bacterium]|nr:sarcosine oxidase subunit alpha family protein [Gammaproteobacteria bacterium]MYH86360.1 sarcosine oxidase subunit alpha family protein [Gammaproteobacteria bacterium]MYK04533.1 sarcosine oxidase subunit alpha family protein [Gammaproteobacteria bacterium]
MAAAQPNRLREGGRIDRSRPLKFSLDGKAYTGFAGDTLASALVANGVMLVGRSFKLRRPRGIVGSGAEEPNAIMQVGEGAEAQPNLLATQVELRDGLVAHTARGWPSVRFDFGAISDSFGRILGAGFYYKTFMYPRSWWKFYERAIRRTTGFGQAPQTPDPDTYEHMNAHCDVLVAGGGPAGLMAALAAASSGARVILANDDSEFGGSLLSGAEQIDGAPAVDWVAGVVTELRELKDCILLPRATVLGYHDHDFLTVAERCDLGEAAERRDRAHPGETAERLWRIRAKRVILAQGGFERPLAFCNNDRPGVMLASAVSTYVHRYAVLPGRRAVVFTNNDSAYRTALDLAGAGAVVEAIVDSRPAGGGELADRAQSLGIPVLPGRVVCDVTGRNRVKSVRIAEWKGDSWENTRSTVRIDCDLLAVSGGWSPAVHLHAQAGGELDWDETQFCFLPGQARQSHDSAGAGNGRQSPGECLADGLRAGLEAAAKLGLEAAAIEAPVADSPGEALIEALWRVPAEKDADRCPKQFIDFQNDTTVADIRLAVREGYRDVEHVKRYTALGFGTDQGKLGNINGMAVLADALGKPVSEVGTTTFRPVYTPVRFGAVAGESVGGLYDPVRKTVLHDWHEAAGAPMEVVGQWHRPWYFPRDGEDLHAAVARECLAVRNSVGAMDASTLGKIDARGPDVVEFLERIYTHNVGRMKLGRCAYGIMLGEDGMVMDDGVMARLGENHFYLTTTTGGAARVLDWLELWLQTEWPELNVYLTSLTEHYSTIAVAGPNSRALLEALGCDIPLDKESFPFLTVRTANLAGMPVQLFRVSFSGELAFEINIGSHFAPDMWRKVMEAGREFDIAPYGTETMHVLRAEKGFVIVGQDTDGSVTPVDLGMNWLLSKEKDFLGKRSLRRPDCLREDRKQLVGLLSSDQRTVLPEGTQLIEDIVRTEPVPMCGHVTSSYDSACLGHPVALALVAGGRARKGENLFAALPGREPLPVQVVSPAFYDPRGERQNV